MKLPFLKPPFLKAKASAPEGWQPGPAYPSLFALQPHVAALRGKGGIYALWHLGVRPQWLWVGAGTDLLACLAAAGPQVEAFRANGDVFATWVFMDAATRPGIVRHLRLRLRPALTGLTGPDDFIPEDAAPVLFPLPAGTTERGSPS